MYDGGEIIIVKNIVFKNRFADHASLKGRPCIVISDYDEKLTMLPLTSNPPSKSRKNTYLKLKSSDFERNSLGFLPKLVEYTNLESMFQRELRYYDIVANIKPTSYYKFLCEMEKMRICSEYYKDVYQDLEYQRNNLSLRLNIKQK